MKARSGGEPKLHYSVIPAPIICAPSFSSDLRRRDRRGGPIWDGLRDADVRIGSFTTDALSTRADQCPLLLR